MSNEALEVPMMGQQDTQPGNTVFDFSLIDNPTPAENCGLLTVKTANAWIEDAKSRPAPRMLFDKLWFEGELCIMFADTNLGKSILAVQIADAISRGEAMPGFRVEAEKQRVIYMDFELSDKQFETRYCDSFANHYRFSDNFLRVEINTDSDNPEDATNEELLNASMEQTIAETGAKVLIVDNITYLTKETEKAKDALPLMKSLKSLKNKYGLSILVLAHTPKRNLSHPLTRNDLQGSKMLINFCDSAFAIGESYRDKRLRYIKQIKQRNCESVFDAENVIVCEVSKPDTFLQFQFLEYGREKDHLRSPEDEQKDRAQLIDQAKQLSAEGKSQREVAKQLQISLSTANTYINK